MLVPDILISNAVVITMDKDRPVLWDGAIAIRDGLIIEIGETTVLRTKFPQAKENIDASHKLLLPGYINAHTYIAMALFRGLYRGDPRAIYSVMFPIEESLEPEDVYFLGLLGAIECLKGGATCIVDHYYFMDEIARAAETVGMRPVLGHTIAERLAPFVGENEKKKAIRFIHEWRDRNPRIRPALAPHSPETVSAESLKELKQISDKQEILLHIHLAQSPQEVAYLKETYNKTPVEFLDSIGFLGRNLLAAHGVFLNDADMDRLKSKHVSVVFCPTSQVAYLYNHVTPVPELLSRGVNVLLGTDTAAGTGNMNILEEPRIAATVQLLRSGAKGLLFPRKLLEMVTVDAARALRLQDKIGSLEAGKRADVIVIDLQNAELAPINDIYALAIHGMTAPHIDSIMIDGQIVLSGGSVLGVDEAELVAKVNEVRNNVLERALRRRPELAKRLIWLEGGE